MNNVYIIFRCQKVVKVCESKEKADKLIENFLKAHDFYTKKDFNIEEWKVV